MNTILEEAQALLGPPQKIEWQRMWATWWCPFHPDAARAGRGGHANFGIHTTTGHWKCLRCGAKGASLADLQRRLGVVRPATIAAPAPPASAPRRVQLESALAEARRALPHSPAWDYLQARGIRPGTAVRFGLGYGLPVPQVPREEWLAAQSARLVSRKGRWLWGGGLVYADPPAAPAVIQVRHLVSAGRKRYQTWGRLQVPLGAWRIRADTLAVIVVEGLFDALAIAQGLQDRRLDPIAVVFTAGAAPARAMLDWFSRAARRFGFLLVPDPDEAGAQWARRLQSVVGSAGGLIRTIPAPDGLDPDEAVLQGWWPFGS